jgi:SAM-dependent methyltransferase
MTTDDRVSAVYDQDVSELYELFYAGRGQDFAADGGILAEVILDRYPGADSVLDVGCGTGSHLQSLAKRFGEVAGVELSESMCALARARLGGAPVHQGDMRDFDLGRTFGAVCCLTSTIGYSRDTAELEGAVRTMARHLEPGGVLVIDPYWTPGNFLDGHVGHDVVRDESRTVARLSTSTRTGTSVRHEAHYLVADAGGIRHLTHVQPLTLFTHEEYLTALERAGCAAEHLRRDGGFVHRGLFVGVRRG